MFPLLAGQALHDFALDIEENGQKEASEWWRSPDGVVFAIDGRNREVACYILGREVAWREWSGPGHPAAHVRSKNLQHRFLTTSQRAFYAAALEVMIEDDGLAAKKRAAEETNAERWGEVIAFGKNANSDNPASAIADKSPRKTVRSRDEVARQSKVSSRAVGEAKRILRVVPELAPAIGDERTDLAEAGRLASVDNETERKLAIAAVLARSPGSVKEHKAAERKLHREQIADDSRRTEAESGRGEPIQPRGRPTRRRRREDETFDIAEWLSRLQEAAGKLLAVLDEAPENRRPAWWKPVWNGLQIIFGNRWLR